jgi:D-psicose/D-tagatose/L-ribulose 3-epimerase
MIPVLKKIKKAGYDALEVPLFLDIEPANYKRWKTILDDIGLERHAITARLGHDNPISPDPAIRQVAIENNKKACECAAVVDAKFMIGPNHSAFDVFTGVPATKQEWEWGVENLKVQAEDARNNGVTLVLEYINRFECYLCSCAEEMVRFIDDVDHPNCKMNWDTFHANIEETDVARAIEDSARHIVHVHLAENHKGIPGVGQVDWDTTFATLKKIGYEGMLVAEAFGGPSVGGKIWRDIVRNEDELIEESIKFIRKMHGRYWSEAAA